MGRSKPDSLLTLTQSFFLNYLQSMRGASSHTVRAYRDALKLFFMFLASEKRKSIADLNLDDVQAEAVIGEADKSQPHGPCTRAGVRAGVGLDPL